jgi:CheY-like chemotaxis protein
VADGSPHTPTFAPGILLVCQDEETLGALAAILQQAGHPILTAQTAFDAWECVKAGAVHAVVLDLNIDGADAWTLFRSVRSSRRTCTLPFLFLISDVPVPPQLEAHGPDTASDAWLALPCTAPQFLASMRELEQKRVNLQSRGGNFAVIAPIESPRPAKRSDPALRAVVDPNDLLKKDSVFSGQLGVLDVTRILSMIEPLKLTGILTLTDGKRTGRVHFIDGAVRHAELHEIEGADALFLLFHLKSGTFCFEAAAPTAKKTIAGNTMTLLLEGLRQMDEAKMLVKSFQGRGGAGAAAGSEAQ